MFSWIWNCLTQQSLCISLPPVVKDKKINHYIYCYYVMRSVAYMYLLLSLPLPCKLYCYPSLILLYTFCERWQRESLPVWDTLKILMIWQGLIPPLLFVAIRLVGNNMSSLHPHRCSYMSQFHSLLIQHFSNTIY